MREHCISRRTTGGSTSDRSIGRCVYSVCGLRKKRLAKKKKKKRHTRKRKKKRCPRPSTSKPSARHLVPHRWRCFANRRSYRCALYLSQRGALVRVRHPELTELEALKPKLAPDLADGRLVGGVGLCWGVSVFHSERLSICGVVDVIGGLTLQRGCTALPLPPRQLYRGYEGQAFFSESALLPAT